jgi:hypothetical protein
MSYSNVIRFNAETARNALREASRNPAIYTDDSDRDWQVELANDDFASSIILTNAHKCHMGLFAIRTSVEVRSDIYKSPFNLTVSSSLSVEAQIPSNIGGFESIPLGRPLTVPIEIDGVVIPEDLSQPHNMSTNANMLEQWSARLPHIIRNARYLD